MLVVIVAIGLVFLAAERLWPDQDLPRAPGWWLRAILGNCAQFLIVWCAGMSWDLLLQRAHVFELGASGWPAWCQGLFGYLVASFVYYWWHRFRHTSNILWLGLHQLHHAPIRIETITAFYKHPLELLCNSVLSGAISYTLLGLSVDGAGWVALFSALSEFFYHVNIRTPRWFGFFLQRPEMHRIHHARDRHTDNFGDLPLWDFLFGTYCNPSRFDGACGFAPPAEERVVDMLCFRDVNSPSPNPQP
jgi:sterol desaturase/sphingolipid hydroxylase (fatty acid hydroxylase superfamily)